MTRHDVDEVTKIVLLLPFMHHKLHHPHLPPPNLRPLNLKLIPQSRPDSIINQQCQSQRPHKSNRIEEICVAAACVDPQVVECWAQEGGVEDCGEGYEGVAVYCILLAAICRGGWCGWGVWCEERRGRRGAELTGEDMPVEW